MSHKLTHAAPRFRPTPSRRPPSCAPRRTGRDHSCEWLDRCLGSRCNDSWRRLLRRFGPRIRQIIVVMATEHGLNVSRAEVEELSQELYLYWLRRGSRFDGKTSGQFWRFVSASIRHLVIDQVRRITADKRSLECDPWLVPLPIDEVESGECGAMIEPLTRLGSEAGRSPETVLVRRENFGDLWRRLIDHCREVVDDERDVEVLERAVLDGHSSRELSLALRRAGRPICHSTIDSWVHRLRLRLESSGLQLPRRAREPDSVWAPKVQ